LIDPEATHGSIFGSIALVDGVACCWAMSSAAIMQQTVMHATPLARGMSLFGWLEASDKQEELGTARQNEATIAPRAECESSGGAPSPKPTQRVLRYESRDPLTGRIWGMPSAFGSGQCLDCPKQAAAPSQRCKDCQIRLAKTLHEVLPAAKMQELRETFAALLPAAASASCRRRQDVAQRLEVLYSQVQAGQIPLAVQAQLLEIAGLAAAGRLHEANQRRASLVAQYWDDRYKDWLLGLSCLLRP